MALIKERPLVRPADAALLVGRDQDLSYLRRSIDLGLNVLVIGDTGAGKTSLLAQLGHQLANARVHQYEFVSSPASANGAELAEAVAQVVAGPNMRYVPAWEKPMRRMGTYEAQPSTQTRMRWAINRMADLEVVRTTDSDDHGPLCDPDADIVVLVDGPQAAAAEVFFTQMSDELARLPFIWIVAVDSRGSEKLQHAGSAGFFDRTLVLEPPDITQVVEIIRRRLGTSSPSKSVLTEALRDRSLSARAAVTFAREIAESDTNTVPATSSEHTRAEAWARVHLLGRPASMLAVELQARGPTSASDEDLLAALGWSRSRASEVLSTLLEAGAVTVSEERGQRPGRPRRLYQLSEDLR